MTMGSVELNFINPPPSSATKELSDSGSSSSSSSRSKKKKPTSRTYTKGGITYKEENGKITRVVDYDKPIKKQSSNFDRSKIDGLDKSMYGVKKGTSVRYDKSRGMVSYYKNGKLITQEKGIDVYYRGTPAVPDQTQYIQPIGRQEVGTYTTRFQPGVSSVKDPMSDQEKFALAQEQRSQLTAKPESRTQRIIKSVKGLAQRKGLGSEVQVLSGASDTVAPLVKGVAKTAYAFSPVSTLRFK